MRIAIYERETLDNALVTSIIKSYFKENKMDLEIFTFTRVLDIFYEIQEGSWYDFILVSLKSDNQGHDDVKNLYRIRRLGYEGIIAMASNDYEFCQHSYSMSIDGYILKPYRIAHVEDLINRVLEKIKRDMFSLSFNGKGFYFRKKNILYVESQNTKCIIHRANGITHNLYKHLSEIAGILNDPNFLRSHRSFLVNMDYIDRVEQNFILKNGEEVFINRREKRYIVSLYNAYLESKPVVLSLDEKKPKKKKEEDKDKEE